MSSSRQPIPTPAQGGTHAPRHPLLVADGVHKAFPMGDTLLHVLRGCDMRVDSGEFVAIMGKSGSGKSTLLHILGALDVPQLGNVYFDGKPIFAPPQQRWFNASMLDLCAASERRRIGLRRHTFGFVFQFYHLLPEFTVLENVLMASMVASPSTRWLAEGPAARRRAREILAQVGLSHRLKHHPNELSGGERQRVAVARALMNRPRVLFADEPTGNLDAEAGGELMRLFRSVHDAGQTIVLVTHDATVASNAGRILLLEDGRLRAV